VERGPVSCISAVTLVSKDMRHAVGFYRRLGFDLLYGGDDADFSSFQVGSGFLNLQLRTDFRHLAEPWGRVIFWVDDVDAMYQRALRSGMSPEAEPADAPWGERYFHLRDPDGHELSFARPIHAQPQA
jgi:catechol 2,3-dioxygenase-like lactoylglutathione lyase family enzyme